MRRELEKVPKFEGGFHGHHDYAMLSNMTPGAAPYPTATPDIGGIPKGTAETVLVALFNDLKTTLTAFSDALRASA